MLLKYGAKIQLFLLSAKSAWAFCCKLFQADKSVAQWNKSVAQWNKISAQWNKNAEQIIIHFNLAFFEEKP
jgi:hypothetical protein